MDNREPINVINKGFHFGRIRLLLAVAPLLIWLAAPLAGQSTVRMWAAQTGPDQVSVAWDSITGATEYRIYVGAPGGSSERRPVTALSASSRSAVLMGMQRLSDGIYLVVVGANGRVLQQAQFNQVTAATTFPSITPPAGVTAEATSATEVTLSWSAVSGATAYSIGRAVAGSGLRIICNLCSTETQYVDRNAMAGFPHTYAVSAIFPNGISRRVSSNQVTPGSTEVATTSGQPLPTASDKLTPSTTTTSTTHTATPISASQTTTTNNPISGVLSQFAGSVLGTQVSPPTGVAATIAGPSAVRVTWQASPTTGLTEYRISRRINSGAWDLLNSVDPSTLAYSDTFFPVTLFASGPVNVSYRVLAVRSGTSSSAATTGELVVQSSSSTAVTPAAGTTATACKLDYQRADNMWAAFGRPDGPLGTETISLSPGQDKVFVTDWKYEKTRNDGTNYYGSHLRIATNSSTSAIRLQLRTTTLTGLAVFVRTGSDTFWIRLAPGKSQQFQADLMEVFCEQ